MESPAFLITIDTEGDDIWGSHANVTTENARYLPRFQDLCRKHGFKPTYLTNCKSKWRSIRGTRSSGARS